MNSNKRVPVWTLATEPVTTPGFAGDADMTPARLAELRSALSALAQTPIATLEMHAAAPHRERSGGISLRASSPLAQQLLQLVAQTTASTPPEVDVAAGGETLYRLIVPAKFAPGVRMGRVGPVASKAVPGGIQSTLRDSKGFVAQGAFVPVAGSSASGGVAAAAGAGMGAAGALTVATPLVLMAVAVGASAAADQEQRRAIERITDLLERSRHDEVERERDRLDGCRDAIDKATSVLLDQGKIGQSLGLDSASHEISTALAVTRTRLRKWQDALDGFADKPVDLTSLTDAFPGIMDEHGAFRAHVETAKLAVALKRRVLVLQAVEHAQLDATGNPFKSFLGELHSDEQRLNDLESSLAEVLLRLSSIELRRPDGLLKRVHYAPADVDKLLAATYHLRKLGPGPGISGQQADVVIDIERHDDGSLFVHPAAAVEP